jgi:chromosome segregation protein
LRTKNDKAAQEKNRELLDIERLVASIEQKKISAEMEEKQIIDKLWDSYELSRSAANQIRHPVENLAAAQKRIGFISAR